MIHLGRAPDATIGNGEGAGGEGEGEGEEAVGFDSVPDPPPSVGLIG